MPTLLYQPGIRVYIHSAKGGVIDVSEDLVQGTMVRRSDGVSTFDFTITNPRRVYDGIFAPNDRIVVLMKRVTWMRVFTGLLNSVPLMSIWPRDVNLRASCSLKRLQYYYWDAYAPESITLLSQLSGTREEAGKASGDHGMGHIATEVLDKVVGWPKSKVHIGQIPKGWIDIAHQIAVDLQGPLANADKAANAVMSKMIMGYVNGSGTSASVGDPSNMSAPAAMNGKLADGSYGGVPLKGDQLRNAETIWAVGKGMGMSDRDCTLALMCAMQESTLRNLSGGDRDSVGLFQQRPSMGWGTVAQCTNPTYAATQFYKHLKNVKNRDSMSETRAIQAVQSSGLPDAYQKWLNMASAMANQLKTMTKSTSSGGSGAASSIVSTTPPKGASVSVAPSGKTISSLPTGASMATTAQSLCTKYTIPYEQHQRRSFADMMKTPPITMDCSLFVSSSMARTLGRLPTNYPSAPRVANMVPWALSNGGRKVSVAEGSKTPGAWMVVLDGKNTNHIGISLGGGQVAAAHTWGYNASVKPLNWGSPWTFAVLPPGFTYEQGAIPLVPGSGDASGETIESSGIVGVPPKMVKYSETEEYKNADPEFKELFGNAAWAPSGAPSAAAVALSNSLVGPRALMNDQPILPYIKNLMYTSMRSFCSAPNGDLIAWFPDYYGLFDQAAKLIIEPIELQDFTVEWSDDAMVTHQFVSVSQAGAAVFDINSGQLSDPGIMLRGVQGDGGNPLAGDMRPFTAGVATIDMPALLTALFGVKQDKDSAKKFAQFIYKRFGARPAYEEMPGLVGPSQAFFGAIYRFMNNWGYQYNADVPITFMPEAWPGMLLQIPSQKFQAYITTVSHSFNMNQGGGFTTSLNISNPARMPGSSGGRPDVFIGLPQAGAREGASIHPDPKPTPKQVAKNPSLNKPRRRPGDD